jgi:hypothetical protein
VLINCVARIHSAQRGIRKVPLPRVKAVSLVDEPCFVEPLIRLFGEDRLPAICIAGPLIDCQNPRLWQAHHYEKEAVDSSVKIAIRLDRTYDNKGRAKADGAYAAHLGA